MTDQLPDIDSAQGDEFTEVDQYAPAVKARAYKLYLDTGLSPAEIAMDIGVRHEVVAAWARQGKWRDRKLEIEKEMFDRASDGYRALIVKHRAPTVERHLRVAEKLENAIEKVIEAETADEDRVPNGMQLKRMAEALSAATGVSARAAAITDRAFMSESEDGAKQGKVPLVAIGIQVSKSRDPEVTVRQD